MHVITKKHLSRRHMLRGSGVTMALPFLTAMVPAATALAQTAAVGKPRLAFVYFPHGAVWRLWQPKGQGADFEMSTILKPLEKHRSRMAVISNLHNRAAESEAVHAITSGTWKIDPAQSTGVFIGTLPVEEALFFGVTVLLISFGLTLALSPLTQARWSSWTDKIHRMSAPGRHISDGLLDKKDH